MQSRHVALVGNCGDVLAIGSHTEVLNGVRQYERADLVVMESIGDLWSCTSEDSGLLVPLVHVICLGKPVTSASALHLADMNPAEIAPRNIVFHTAAISKQVLSLRYTAFFRDAHPDVLLALKACAAQENSKWDVDLTGKPMAAKAKEVKLEDIPTFAKWLSSECRLHRGNCKVSRA